MASKRTFTWLEPCFPAGAGLILGAFISRVLAELPQTAWPTYRWWLTGALALLGAALFVGLWALGRKLWPARSEPVGQESEQHGPARQTPVAITASVPFFLLIPYLVQPAPNLLQAGVLLIGALGLSLLLSNTSADAPDTPDDKPGTLEARPGAAAGEPDPAGLSSNASDAEPAQGAQLAGWAIVLLLFIVPLIAYLATMAPGVGTRDGYELQAVSATLGFAHPTGYPLFPILGYLWLAVFPFDAIASTAIASTAVAWQINLLCAVYAAASVPLIYGTARRLVGRRSFAAWGALLYGFSLTLWTQASQPEKYTLNALFVSLVLYLALGTSDPHERGPHPRLRWLALAYGLSLAHHRTMLMLAPALAIYLLWRDPGLLRRPKQWLPALGIALAPLLIYLYIPWRAYAQGWAMTASEFLAYISGSYYGPAVRLMDWATPERAGMFWRFVRAQYGLVGVGLALVGVYGLAQARRWRVLATTAVAYVTYYFWGTVWYAYYNDVNSFIPNHALMAIWIAAGGWTIWSGLRAWATKRLGTCGDRVHDLGWTLLWVVAATMPMAMVWRNGPQVDRSGEWEMTRWGEYAMGLEIAEGATVLADREKHPPLDYYARVEGRRPDLDVVILGDERAYLERLAWDLAHETPVYLARFLPGLESRYSLHSLGPLVRVDEAPQTDPGAAGAYRAPPEAPVRYAPPEGAPSEGGAQIELLGYQAEGDAVYRAGERARFTLLWRSLWPKGGPRPGNLQVNLRLVSEAGSEWWASAAHPVSGMYPTGAWRAGEVVADWHEIDLADDLPPGRYTVEVGLFYPFSRSGLRVQGADAESDWARLLTLTVEPPRTPPQIPRRVRAIAVGRVQLVGYDLQEQAPPTGRVPLRLYWQAIAPLADYEIGTAVAVGAPSSGLPSDLEWTWSTPGRGEYPTSAWAPGQRVITGHSLAMPAGQGPATVYVAMRPALGTGSSQPERVTFRPRWLAARQPGFALSAVQIVGQPPAAPGTINYGDRILLLNSDRSAYEGRELPPGAPVELAVVWQAAQAMEHDYTLFVQLLGPDGTLKGQIDVWPRDGTFPTSQWVEGEPVDDRYLLYLDADAPPGRYQVAVGWYLLETMQRLPVLDAQGRAVDDKVLLPGPVVSESAP